MARLCPSIEVLLNGRRVGVVGLPSYGLGSVFFTGEALSGFVIAVPRRGPDIHLTWKLGRVRPGDDVRLRLCALKPTRPDERVVQSHAFLLREGRRILASRFRKDAAQRREYLRLLSRPISRPPPLSTPPPTQSLGVWLNGRRLCTATASELAHVNVSLKRSPRMRAAECQLTVDGRDGGEHVTWLPERTIRPDAVVRLAVVPPEAGSDGVQRWALPTGPRTRAELREAVARIEESQRRHSEDVALFQRDMRRLRRRGHPH